MATESDYSGPTAGNGMSDPFEPDHGSKADRGAFRGAGLRATLLGGDAVSMLQERSTLVYAVLAALIGALVGLWLANRSTRRSKASVLARLAEEQAQRAAEVASRTAKRGREAGQRAADLRSRVADRTGDGAGVRTQVSAGAALVPILLRFLSNPLVQHYIRRAVVRQLARPFAR